MKRILAMLLALVMVVGLVACGGNSGKSDKLNVGVFYYTYDDAYMSSVRAAIDTELKDLGVAFTNYDCQNDQSKQNDLITTAITNGCNMLVVNLVNSGNVDAAKKVMDLADGLPVLFINRAVEGTENEGEVLNAYDNIGFIGTDAPEAGHMQGKMVAEYLLADYDAYDLNGDGKISYALMKGDEGNVEAIYRTQYGVEDADAGLTAAGKPALEYFNPTAETKYQVDQAGAWSTQAALDYMNTNLAEYNEVNNNMIELVICNNDGMAVGVVQALNAAGYNNGTGKTIPVFGVDATDDAKALISEGKMAGTVKQDAEGMAKAVAQTVKALSEGKSMVDSLAAAAGTGDNFSISGAVAAKLYVAYAPYTG